MHFRFLIPAGLVLIGLLFAGCGRDSSDTGPAPKPDAFVFARGSDAMKLDPADIDDGESVNTLAQCLEGLVKFEIGTLDIVPSLAESWEISDDGLTYRFRLREGVNFHDGTPLNAATALFSFRRQMDPDHPAHLPEASFQYWANLYGDITDAVATGPMTVELRLSRPNASLLYSLCSFPVWLISPTAFAAYGADIQRIPVGTGPYRFVDWKPNQAVIFERFDGYWGEPAGFERLVIRPIPENTARLAALRGGEIHGLDGLQPNEIGELQDNPRFTVYHQPGMNVGYLAISDFAERLRDPEVRRALAMAIDRQAIVDLAIDGYGQVAHYPAPAGFLGVPDDSGPFPHDPEAARAIIARHPELLAKPIRLHSLTAPRPYFPDPSQIASLIRSDLEAVGLEVEIIAKDFKSHLYDTRRGDFELGMLGWSGDNGDTDNFLATFFHSRAAVKDSATNISFYRNPEMDRLLDAAVRAVDLEERARIYRQALEIWARDLPLIPLLSTEQIVVLRSEVTGFQLARTANHFFGPIGWKE